VSFKVRHMMVSNVQGGFTKFSGTLNLDDKDVTKSTLSVDIDVASVDTRNPKRDEHLKSADFFDVAKFPKMTFKSTKVEKQGDKYLATGDLTLHGVTKPVTLTVTNVTGEVKDAFGAIRRGAQATGKINRKDFGLTWNKALEAGGVAVGEDVSLDLEVECTKKEAPAPKKADATPVQHGTQGTNAVTAKADQGTSGNAASQKKAEVANAPTANGVNAATTATAKKTEAGTTAKTETVTKTETSAKVETAATTAAKTDATAKSETTVKADHPTKKAEVSTVAVAPRKAEKADGQATTTAMATTPSSAQAKKSDKHEKGDKVETTGTSAAPKKGEAVPSAAPAVK
jgi:polyisoprenoid-binding protein YceI